MQPPPGGMGGGGMPGGGAAPPTGGDKDKDGPAEAAPKDKGALAPVVPVPAQPEGRRRLQLFELHGNLRMRADFFHRLDLDLFFTEQDGLDNKFFLPPSEMGEFSETNSLRANDAGCAAQLSARGVSPSRVNTLCKRRRSTAGANMRLRLEPTIHVTDTVKIHSQVDLLDNLVLGSTPDSFAGESPWAPTDLFTRTQYAPQDGVNSFNDSITVKRAWGEIRFGFGMTLEFGRMPNHWGLGIVQNDGNGYARGEKSDIIRMVDTDYGDSSDSVRLTFDFGPDKRNAMTLGVSYDWAASGPTTAQLLGPEWESGNLVAQTLSAELYDNVHQFGVWIERRDDAAMLQRKLSSGTPVVNYGLKTWLRWQTIGRAIGTPGLGDGLGGNPSLDDTDPVGDLDGLSHAGVPLGNGLLDDDGNSGLNNYSASLVHRRGWLLTPDLWLRVNWRTMRIEAEGALIVGNFRHRDLTEDRSSDDFNINAATGTDLTKVLQFGYALEFKYGLFKDRFHIGLDHGFASGDSSQPYRNQYQSPLPTTNGGDYAGFGTFRFNPAYMQDMLLFKELLGTVANAAYVKPWAAFYFFQDNVSARADVEFAGAVDQRGTLAGDRSLWGLEIAGSVRYHDAEEPIFFQLQYGAMFPFGAWNPVLSGVNANGDPTTNRVDARAAQTVQAQLGIRF
ncbi:TIGR04551 family protein [Enhygromyxa salina]|nr:TIGR04551 family protein [Enhygromyxa salina]